MTSDKTRNSSVELLRIFAIIGVIFLHYIDEPGGILQRVQSGTLNYYLVVLINSIACGAVDLFVFISGWYLSKNTTISMRKISQLLLEVIFFQTGVNLIRMIGTDSFTVMSLLRNLIPRKWFVTLYIAMYCLSPYINVFINSLNEKQHKSLVFLTMILFLVQPTIIEVLEGLSGTSLMGASTVGIQGAQWGYTIVTFINIYLLAGFLRKKETEIKDKIVFIIWASCGVCLFVWKLVELQLGRSIAAEHYQNPAVVLLAATTFLLFIKRSFYNRVINAISKNCFTVYIMHASLVQILFIDFNTINGSMIGFASALLIRVFLIYSICTISGFLYAKVEKWIFDLLDTKLRCCCFDYYK